MNYYNEFEPFAAAWLRNLIAEGLIPAGEVDERSICDVRAADLVGFQQCHFFAGIGGWSLALRLAGVADDAEVWTGSCPCQPFSVAGKSAAQADKRHLWPEFARLVGEREPPIVLGEQVSAAIGHGWLDGICADLEALGYACGAAVLPACAVGAPHRRERLWWVGVEHSDERRHGHAVEALRAGRARLEPSGRDERMADAGSRGAAGERDGAGRADQHVGFAAGAGGGDGFRDNSARNRAAATRDAGEAGLQRMAHAQGQRPGRGPDDEDGRRGQRAFADRGAGGGFWDDAVWLAGADGKARRVKPGVRLLADGVSNRVGRLRGYGNAIVPQVAAEFITASLEAIDCARLFL